MVNTCSLCGGKEGSLFRIPQINKQVGQVDQAVLKDRRRVWLNVYFKCRKKVFDKNIQNFRVCDRHFVTGKPAHFKDIKNEDWAPTRNLTRTPKKTNAVSPQSLKSPVTTPKSSVKDINWIYKRDRLRRKLFRNDPDFDEVHNGVAAENGMVVENIRNEIASENVGNNDEKNAQNTGTSEHIVDDKEIIANLLKQLTNSRLSNARLQYKVGQLSLTEASFENNDKKTKYFTGLSNFKLLKHILNYIDVSLNHVVVRKLTNFQKLLLTLMKLRKNYDFADLAYRFDISTDTASRVFEKVVVLLEYSLRYVVHWPERKNLRLLMPECFIAAFGNSVAVIIDTFGIKTERPSSMEAASLLYSTYYHAHTVKFLIGITPHCFISYISSGWGGRASDKHISEEPEFLDHLVPGDIVLADRGFRISEVVAVQQCTLKTPAFVKGKNQLHNKEIQESRSISAVRIHVERVIGVLRQKFEILNGVIPITILNCEHNGVPLLDIVLRTCCILTNLCDRIVDL